MFTDCFGSKVSLPLSMVSSYLGRRVSSPMDMKVRLESSACQVCQGPLIPKTERRKILASEALSHKPYLSPENDLIPACYSSLLVLNSNLFFLCVGVTCA